MNIHSLYTKKRRSSQKKKKVYIYIQRKKREKKNFGCLDKNLNYSSFRKRVGGLNKVFFFFSLGG